MDRTEYLAALRALGWSARELARQMGRPVGTVGNWCKIEGGYPIPPNAAAWLRLAAAAHMAWMGKNPPPGR